MQFSVPRSPASFFARRVVCLLLCALIVLPNLLTSASGVHLILDDNSVNRRASSSGTFSLPSRISTIRPMVHDRQNRRIAKPLRLADACLLPLLPLLVIFLVTYTSLSAVVCFFRWITCSEKENYPYAKRFPAARSPPITIL